LAVIVVVTPEMIMPHQETGWFLVHVPNSQTYGSENYVAKWWAKLTVYESPQFVECLLSGLFENTVWIEMMTTCSPVS